jgi:hypothetical protein
MSGSPFFDTPVVRRLWRRWERLLFPRLLSPSCLWAWGGLPLLAVLGASVFWAWPTRAAFDGRAVRVDRTEAAASPDPELVALLSGHPHAGGFPDAMEVHLVRDGLPLVLPMRLVPVDADTVTARLGAARVDASTIARGATRGGAWFVATCAKPGACGGLPDGVFPVRALGPPARVLDFLPRRRVPERGLD